VRDTTCFEVNVTERQKVLCVTSVRPRGVAGCPSWDWLTEGIYESPMIDLRIGGAGDGI